MAERIRYLRELVWPLHGLEGLDSQRTAWRLRLDRRRSGEVENPPPESAVRLRVRRLGGRGFHVRPRSTDFQMLVGNMAGGFHLPPAELDSASVARVAEFGTNIGAALADLAVRFPRARLLGVEPGPANAELARRNLAPWADRCEILESAVWVREADLVVDQGRPQYGLVVREREPGDPPEWPVVRAQTPETLLDRLGPGATVDYLYVQVEGTEQRLFTDAAGWLDRVRCVKVEVDGQYGGGPQRIAEAMVRSGLLVRIQPVGWGAFVVGIRPSG